MSVRGCRKCSGKVRNAETAVLGVEVAKKKGGEGVYYSRISLIRGGSRYVTPVNSGGQL